ncbi:MAG: hypothetical protein U0103_01500 [Candidatus Obscuribacterales bacterium]
MFVNFLVLGWNVPSSANSGTPFARALLVAVLLGQHLFADSHTAATYLRIYPGADNRQRFEFFTKYLPLALVPTFLYGLIALVVRVILFISTFSWYSGTMRLKFWNLFDLLL